MPIIQCDDRSEFRPGKYFTLTTVIVSLASLRSWTAPLDRLLHSKKLAVREKNSFNPRVTYMRIDTALTLFTSQKGGAEVEVYAASW